MKQAVSLRWRHVAIVDRAYLDGVAVAICVLRNLRATARRVEPCLLGGEWIAHIQESVPREG